MRNNIPRIAGFTIIEILLVTALTAIVLGLAIPSFNSLLANTKTRTKASLLHATLHNARVHAITAQTVVIVCAASSNNPRQCNNNYSANSNWASGWLAYQDNNRNNRLDDTDKILNTVSNEDVGVVFNQRGRLRFFADGSARSAGFYICNKHSETASHIRLLYSGRARMTDSLSKKQLSKCKNTI